MSQRDQLARPADLLAGLNAQVASASFVAWLGLRFVAADPDSVLAEVDVGDVHLTRPGVVHGGVLMAIADAVGGLATRVSLAPGEGTTTIESKTNFLRAAPSGMRLRARADALHKGRTTMVWQTTIRDADGRIVSITTQTQLIVAVPAGATDAGGTADQP